MEPLPAVAQLLTCVECDAEPEDSARGWRAYLCDVDDDGLDEVLCYCPRCAAAEQFHPA